MCVCVCVEGGGGEGGGVGKGKGTCLSSLYTLHKINARHKFPYRTHTGTSPEDKTQTHPY